MKQTTMIGQKHPGIQTGRVETLHETLASLERGWLLKANSLERKRRSTNNYTHWKARGSQESLRRVAKDLREIRRRCRSASALHANLSDYVRCLEKNCGDAREETMLPVSKHGIPVIQWRAEGEYLVLLDIWTKLASILEDDTYTTRP